MLNNDEIRFSLEIRNEKIDRLALKEVVGKKYVFLDTIYKKQWLNGKSLSLKEREHIFCR